MSEFATNVSVTFGDCDPAGIVFYPNVYRWFDRAFHEWTRPLGGHKQICKALDAIGTGLLETGAQFHYPLRDGDVLMLSIEVERWSRKTLRLRYEGHVGERLCVSGFEVRALFKHGEQGMTAADIGAFRDMVEASATTS